MQKNFKVLFIFVNPRSVSVPPPVVPLFYRILSDNGITMRYFDTTFYDISSKEGEADKFKEKTMAVKPFKEKLIEKRGEIHDGDMIGDLQKEIQTFSPDLIMTTATESSFINTVDVLKKIRHFKIPTILGGVFATFASDLALSFDEIDMLCVGEGEETIVNLCERLRDGKSLSGVPNLWVKEDDGSVTKSPLSPPIDLDKNPIPDMSIFDPKRFYRAMSGEVYKMIPVETHRGCPHVCAFCNTPLQNRLYREKTNSSYFRKKSIKRVIEEIKYYCENYNPEYLFLWAENFFTYSEEEIDEFCDFYSGVKLPFYCQSHPHQLSEHKVRRLKEAGMHRMSLGVEHGNEEFRRKVVNRYYPNEKLIEGVKILHKYDVSFNTNNICGFPTETPDLVMDTVKLNRILKPTDSTCSIFTPFHGTPLRNLAVNLGYLKNPDIIASANTEESILEMPQFTKDQITGKARTFNLYVILPENRWKEIEKAEALTPEGDKIWNELRELRDKYVD